MARDTADDHYESKFEFPLLKLIMERAEKKDISYLQAAGEVLPEYQKGIKYRDDVFELEEIRRRQAQWNEVFKKQD